MCILKIKNRKYAFEKIRLHTPRPFVFDEMVLDLNMGAPDRGGDVDILRKKVRFH